MLHKNFEKVPQIPSGGKIEIVVIWLFSQIFQIYIVEPNSCPVQLFKLYLSKLNKQNDRLWQRPGSGYVNYNDDEWFESRPVGHDMLERFMKLSLTKNVKLDGSYTNHSIRATVISTLDKDGFEARHIAALSSHKNEATIKEYSVKCPETKKREMFASLTNALTPQNKKQKLPTKPAETAPNPNNNDSQDTDDKNVIPTFDIQPLSSFDTIDDDLLLQIVRETEQTEQLNQLQTTDKAHVVPAGQNVTNNTQVINQTIPNFPRLPMPAMYFPNSNVTINYNFNK